MGLLDSCAVLKYLFKLVGFVGSQGLTYSHFCLFFLLGSGIFFSKKKKKRVLVLFLCGSGRVRGTILLVFGDYILASDAPILIPNFIFC